uniref:Protein CUSTOS n=1 Tax=Rhabditophanes sp. KR3021 TaxID=114890 RepID=A0AC35U7N1_9BILA
MSSSTVTVSSGRGNSFSDFENQIHALNHHRIVSSSSENELGATEKDDFIFKMKKCPASKKFKITNSIKEVNNEFSSDSEEETPLKKTYSRLAKDKKRATNNSNLTVKENYSSPKQPEEEDSDDDDGDYNVMDHFRIIHKGAPIVKCNEDDL